MADIIVLSAQEDPHAGYNTSMSGINGILVSGAIGFMRILSANRESHGHIICSDFVVSATMAAIFDLWTNTLLVTSQKSDKVTKKCIFSPKKETAALTKAIAPPKIYTVTLNHEDLKWGIKNTSI